MGEHSPGAKMSTIEPKFEKEAIVSKMSIAPTVMAVGVRAGEKNSASSAKFPA